MTREEAAEVLELLYGDCDPIEENTWLALRMGVAALREKAERERGCAYCVVGKGFIIDAPTYVECDRCAIMLGVEATGDGALQGIYRYDDQIIKDWNQAMGYREEEGHD